MKRTPALLAGALLLASCSIKEARQDCPCQLEIDLDAFAQVAPAARLVLQGGRTFARSSERQLGPADSSRFFTLVPRRSVQVTALSRLHRMQLDGTALRMREGLPADSVYCFSALVDCSDERVYTVARAHKQFASLSFFLTVPPGADAAYRFRLHSDTNGMDIGTLLPLDGAFQMEWEGNQEGKQLRLLRQRPANHLSLDVLQNEKVVQALPLGQWIGEAGYDWTAPDLDDLLVCIDLVTSEATLQIAPWEAGETYRLTF